MLISAAVINFTLLSLLNNSFDGDTLVQPCYGLEELHYKNCDIDPRLYKRCKSAVVPSTDLIDYILIHRSELQCRANSRGPQWWVEKKEGRGAVKTDWKRGGGVKKITHLIDGPSQNLLIQIIFN
jgi:hypothetical protein